MNMFRNISKALENIVKKNRAEENNITNNSIFDVMQHYTQVGEYSVGAPEGTPGDKDFDLIVYKNDNGILYQALRPKKAENLAPLFVRKFEPRLNRFRAFQNKKNGRRFIVEEHLDEFINYVKNYTRTNTNSINIGIITDTHQKDVDSLTSYGRLGLLHLKEFNYLEERGFLKLKVHLGDWIDGSDPGLVDEQELINLRNCFSSKRIDYALIKGNHDENDKFDALHEMLPSFPEREFEDIMWTNMYRQHNIHYISRQHGVAYFDYGDLRIIMINTSDVPYILDDNGKKKYNTQHTLALSEDQVQEIIEILEKSVNKQIIFMGHAVPIDRKGMNSLKYNGRSLHELMVAFNQREKGYLNSHDVPLEYTLTNKFDFSNVVKGKIIAYFAGHAHAEDQYRINSIQYITFNCSALVSLSDSNKYNHRYNRQVDQRTEYAGYVVNVDLDKKLLQVFGYGAASKRRVYRI